MAKNSCLASGASLKVHRAHAETEIREESEPGLGLVHGSVGKSSCWHLALPKDAPGRAELLCGTGQGEVPATDKRLNVSKTENSGDVGKGLRVLGRI